jgi:hypothetical protein
MYVVELTRAVSVSCAGLNDGRLSPMKSFFAFALACLLLGAAPSFADSLGNKYSCTGRALKSNGKSITLKNAKAALNASITSTKTQKKNAVNGSVKEQRLAAKLASLRATLAEVKKCGAGTHVQKAIQDLIGTYTSGTWNNTTFSTTGGISAVLSLDGALLSVSINVGGDMFGSLHPGPIEFQKNVGGVTFPFHFTAAGTTIGDLDITITSAGGIQVTETLVPALPSILRATLTASDSGAGITGTFESFLVGNTKLAEGTMTLQ